VVPTLIAQRFVQPVGAALQFGPASGESMAGERVEDPEIEDA
jgi:hypothetical protein